MRIIQAFCLGTYQQLFASDDVIQGSSVVQ